MAEHILTADDAESFLRGTSGVTGGDLSDSDLVELYLGAVDEMIEDIVGPVVPGVRTFVCDGGRAVVMVPITVRSVDSITVNGTAAAPGSFTLHADAGLIQNGTPTTPTLWPAGQVVVTAQVGYNPIPDNIKLAAGELLRHLWAPRQGIRPGLGGADPGGATVPSSFAVPRRVRELLAPTTTLPGFA